MLKILAPVGILIAALPIQAVEAARCPAGQIFRVSLNKCATKSANAQFLARPRVAASVAAAKAKFASRVLVLPPRREPSPEAEPKTRSVRNYTPAESSIDTPFSAKPSEPAVAPSWPYGALR